MMSCFKKDSELTKEAAQKQAISDAFQDASDSLRDYADANDMTAESVSKFQQRQTAAIDAMQKTSLGARAASVGVGLLTSALTAAGIAFVTMAAQWAWDNLITPIETAAEKHRNCVKKQNHYSLRLTVSTANSKLQTTGLRSFRPKGISLLQNRVSLRTFRHREKNSNVSLLFKKSWPKMHSMKQIKQL